MSYDIFEGRVYRLWGCSTPQATITSAGKAANRRNARNLRELPLLAWSGTLEAVEPTITDLEMLDKQNAHRAAFVQRMKAYQHKAFANADHYIEQLIAAIGLEAVEQYAHRCLISMRPHGAADIADYWHQRCREHNVSTDEATSYV